jgi:hypothetical protein
MTASTVRSAAPEICEASLLSNGSVIEGRSITRAEAEVLRNRGKEVVVCGRSLQPNARSLVQLRRFSKQMTDRAKDFVKKRCLHDAQLISPTGYGSALPSSPRVRTWVNFLRLNGNIVSIQYLLWGEARISASRRKWPFSKVRPHWVHDEVDTDPMAQGRDWHRILLSDGRAISVPFFDVFVHALTEQNFETAIDSRGSVQPIGTSESQTPERRIITLSRSKDYGFWSRRLRSLRIGLPRAKRGGSESWGRQRSDVLRCSGLESWVTSGPNVRPARGRFEQCRPRVLE